MLKTIVLPERCKLEEPSDMIEKWGECVGAVLPERCKLEEQGVMIEQRETSV